MAKTFIIKITDCCNLACRYCSYPAQKKVFFSLELWKIFLKELKDFCNFFGEKEIRLIFHGGEPLLWGEKNLKQALKIAVSELGNFTLDLNLQTNGTIVNPELFKIFKEYNVSLGVSIDGPCELHNLYRVTPAGKGSFSMVKTFLDELSRYGLSCGVLSVISPSHIGKEEEFWQFFKNLGYPLRLSPLSPLGRGKELISSLGYPFSGWYAEFLIRLYQVILNDFMGYLEDFISINPIDKIIHRFLKLTDNTECTFVEDCSAQFVSVDFQGNVYPCGRLSKKEKFCYGNLKEKTLIDMLSSKEFPLFRRRKEILLKEDCKECRFFKYCYGGCPATGINGNPFRKTAFCEDYKRLFEYFSGDGLELLRKRLLAELSQTKEVIGKLQTIKEKLWGKR